jgi:nitrate/nitrite transporter NarK
MIFNLSHIPIIFTAVHRIEIGKTAKENGGKIVILFVKVHEKDSH